MVTSVMTLTAISLERLVPPNIFSGYTSVYLEIYGKLCHSVFHHHFIAGNGIENRVRLDGNGMFGGSQHAPVGTAFCSCDYSLSLH